MQRSFKEIELHQILIYRTYNKVEVLIYIGMKKLGDGEIKNIQTIEFSVSLVRVNFFNNEAKYIINKNY